MDIVTPQTRELAGEGMRPRIEQLLRNYPDVSPAEAAEILHFDRKAPFLEKGRISMDDELRPRLERFRADHASDYRMSLRDWLTVALVVAALVAGFVFLSDLYVS
jgi:hypothetical protein